MNNETKKISFEEIIGNFSKAAVLAETNGQTIIYQDGKPKFLVVDMESESFFEITDDEKIDIAAKRVLERFKPAFKELAK